MAPNAKHKPLLHHQQPRQQQHQHSNHPTGHANAEDEEEQRLLYCALAPASSPATKSGTAAPAPAVAKETATHGRMFASRREKSEPTQQQQQQEQQHCDRSLESYIPPYLRGMVLPYHGDFCFSPLFHPRLIAQCMMEGFLPIANSHVLLPKIHEQRCVIYPLDGEHLHVAKSVRKKAKKFTMTINTAFDAVVSGCREQHGSSCWLYPALTQGFRALHQATVTENPSTVSLIHAQVYTNNNYSSNNNNKSSSHHHQQQHQQQQQSQQSQKTGRTAAVRLYSIEVWNAETRELVAGELGYTVGNIYTSLTGFSRQDSAGSVQMAALGRLLIQLGFACWDLGMEMNYKHSLGAHLMPRHFFVTMVQSVRESHQHLKLQLPPPTPLPLSSSSPPLASLSSNTSSNTQMTEHSPTVKPIPAHDKPTLPALGVNCRDIIDGVLCCDSNAVDTAVRADTTTSVDAPDATGEMDTATATYQHQGELRSSSSSPPLGRVPKKAKPTP